MSDPIQPLNPAETSSAEKRAGHESYPVRLLDSIDKTIAVAAGGTPDVTISADAGIAAAKDHGVKGFYGRAMSGFLGLFQKHHVQRAAAGDYEHAEQAEQLILGGDVIEQPEQHKEGAD